MKKINLFAFLVLIPLTLLLVFTQSKSNAAPVDQQTQS